MRGRELDLRRIQCAVCRRLVDWWEIEMIPSRDARKITVRCHGAEEIMEISNRDLADLYDAEIVELAAFRPIKTLTVVKVDPAATFTVGLLPERELCPWCDSPDHDLDHHTGELSVELRTRPKSR